MVSRRGGQVKELLALEAEYQRTLEEAETKLRKLSKLRLGIFSLLVLLWMIPSLGHTIKIAGPLGLMLLFIVLVRRSGREQELIKSMKGRLSVIGDYRSREDDSWLEREDGSLYGDHSALVNDLDLVGRGSLFQYISSARTLGGKEKLLEDLTQGIVAERQKKRRSSIRELFKNLPLIIEFEEKLDRIKGVSSIRASHYLDDLVMKREFKRWDLLVSISLSVLFIGTLILFALGLLPGILPVLLFIIQLYSGMLYERLYAYELGQINSALRGLGELQGVMELINESEFKEPSLQTMQQRIREASSIRKNLSRLSLLESFRRSLVSHLLLNTFVSWNRLLVLFYKKLVEKDKPKLVDALLVIEELEVLLSLGTINLLKEHWCEPVSSKELFLEVLGLYQPVVKESNCVPNDIRSGKEVNIITGSNMSGKTFFMKSIALNLLLHYAGGFVNADVFKVPELRIFTSINVQDDITEGISTFYAELLRVKDMLEYDRGPFIAFIDEIFKGTNYEDRLLGAKSVIRSLQKRKAIVFITTHDRELSYLEGVVNYHFEEQYKDGLMDFDHSIRKGTTSTTNATELMRGLGILD